MIGSSQRGGRQALVRNLVFFIWFISRKCEREKNCQDRKGSGWVLQRQNILLIIIDAGITIVAERGDRGDAGSQRGRHDADRSTLVARLFRVVGRGVAAVLVRFQQKDGADVELRDLVEDGQRQHDKHEADQQIDCQQTQSINVYSPTWFTLRYVTLRYVLMTSLDTILAYITPLPYNLIH